MNFTKKTKKCLFDFDFRRRAYAAKYRTEKNHVGALRTLFISFCLCDSAHGFRVVVCCSCVCASERELVGRSLSVLLLLGVARSSQATWFSFCVVYSD